MTRTQIEFVLSKYPTLTSAGMETDASSAVFGHDRRELADDVVGITLAADWLKKIKPGKTINRDHTAATLAAIAANTGQGHVSCGAFIVAALAAGYWYEPRVDQAGDVMFNVDAESIVQAGAFRKNCRQNAGRTMFAFAERLAVMLAELQDDLAHGIIDADRECFDSAEGFDALNVVEHLRDAAGTAYLLAHGLAGIDITAHILTIMAPPDGGQDSGPTRRPWR